uniref:Thiamine-phosphate synthase n=1 Tax=Ammonifex degensii TaxID=42838 RepID=A0A7C2EIY3_9THEO
MMEIKVFARMADANLNRAREGLRVMEDVARFILQESSLTERVREARHKLRQAAALLPFECLTARDVKEDPGVDFPEEPHPSAGALAISNARRVQEAARVLEETARFAAPEVAGDFKRLRFLAYELEQLFAARLSLKEKASFLKRLRLYVIVGSAHTSGRPVVDVAREAIRGGAQIIQLREKELPARDFLASARALREVTAKAGVPLIINDRADIAAAVGADGVHLGQEDLPPAAARRLLGERAIIGVSTHSVSEALRAEKEGADYIGFGPVFPTKTKPECAARGVEALKEVLGQVRLPVVAIGGITPANLPQVLGAGARRVAVVSAVAGAANVAAEAALLLKMLEGFN